MRVFVAPPKPHGGFGGVSDFPRGKGAFMETTKSTKKLDVRRLVFTALMGAIAILLSEFLKFEPTMLMPSFITFDFSDAPEMLAALTMGPVSGVFVCLIKNIWGLFTSQTAYIGELSNFILGVSLVIPAGLIARNTPKFSRAVWGSLAGCAVMAAVSFPSNYFIMYPFYEKFMPVDQIVAAYQAINPNVSGLAECLLVFNVPFTFVKGLVASILSVVLYKKLRPVFNSIYRVNVN